MTSPCACPADRTGLIACQYRAAAWGHEDVELAAHDLLRYLDGART